MTPAEHRREVEAVTASLLLGTTRAERHGVYPVRKPPIVVVVRPVHVFVVPVVTEKTL